MLSVASQNVAFVIGMMSVVEPALTDIQKRKINRRKSKSRKRERERERQRGRERERERERQTDRQTERQANTSERKNT
jgi:hypothetical protein